MVTAKAFAHQVVSAGFRAFPTALALPIRDVAIRGNPGSPFARAAELLRYKPVPVDVFVLPDNPNLCFVNAKSAITQRLFWLGEHGYEGEESQWWRRLCREATGILEIGANLGYYTVQGASAAPTTPYTAVEPHPVTASYLRRNLGLNHLTHVRVIEAAAVDDASAGAMDLLVPDADPDAAPAGAFLADADEIDRASSRHVTVPLVATTDLMNGVDLLKLDTEGSERRILLSIDGVIAIQRPTILVELRSRASDLREYLESLRQRHGYRVFAIAGERLHEIQSGEPIPESPKQMFGNRDLILTVRHAGLAH